MSKPNAITTQLLYIAEHVAVYGSHAKDLLSDDRFMWTGDTDEVDYMVTVEYQRRERLYKPYVLGRKFMVPWARLGFSHLDGSQASMVVERNSHGNPHKTIGSIAFAGLILDKLFYYPGFDEAEQLFEGLEKIQADY